jgi:NADP-dependent 3-hydroxy acid dehydrogenase YdfG
VRTVQAKDMPEISLLTSPAQSNIADSDPDEWWRTWQVNTFGAYLIVRATVPLLLKKNDGLKTILNVSSIGAHMVNSGLSAYQSSMLNTASKEF